MLVGDNASMSNESVDLEKQGLKNILKIIFITLAVCVLIAGIFTNYKQETLICSKSENKCYVEKTNLINQKSKKYLVDYSDIESVGYLRQKVKGNRYAKGYSSYLLVFNLKNNNPLLIFYSDYYDKSELDSVIKNLTNQMSGKNDKIILNRD